MTEIQNPKQVYDNSLICRINEAFRNAIACSNPNAVLVIED